MISCRAIACCLIIGVLVGARPNVAAEPARAADAVAATVGEAPIYAREVQRWLDKAARGKTVAPEALLVLQAQVLEEIINRRLVLAAAQRSGEAPGEKELARAFEGLKSQLAARGKTLQDYLKAQSLNDEELRRQLAWNMVWEKHWSKIATPAGLRQYFEAHRREFDGTQLSVSHILLTPSPSDKTKGVEGQIARLQAIREDVLAGKISFADAAKKYSAGPSGKDGGKLGLIGRHGPMDASFSTAAFALAEGEISPPVRTPFGVHLIRCDAIQPGAREFAEVEPDVRDGLARELLEKLAQSERTRTPVKFAPGVPHFQPNTRELATP